MIWYTGHGLNYPHNKGDWFFDGGTRYLSGSISFEKLYTMYKNHMSPMPLIIVSDCCYSGAWKNKCKETVQREYGQCGHKSRGAGIFLKVQASCQEGEQAYDLTFSRMGVEEYHGENKSFTFRQGVIGDTDKRQTPTFFDSTEIICNKKRRIECQ